MDTRVYIFYGALFVVIFLGLLFPLAKGLGIFKNFPRLKKRMMVIKNKASTGGGFFFEHKSDEHEMGAKEILNC